jgi:hypothetical protein
LFFGYDDRANAPDRGAVILWRGQSGSTRLMELGCRRLIERGGVAVEAIPLAKMERRSRGVSRDFKLEIEYTAGS